MFTVTVAGSIAFFFPFGSRSFQFGRKLGTVCCSLCIRCWCESSWSNESLPRYPITAPLKEKNASLGGTVNKQLAAVIMLASRNEIHKFFTLNCLFAGVTREGVCTMRSMCYLTGAVLSQNTGNKRI